MMRAIVRAFAVGVVVAAMAACNNLSSGPAIPPTPEGAQAPSKLEVRPPSRQAEISDEQRTEFEQLIRRYLDAAQERFAAGMAERPEAPEQLVTLQPGGEHRWHVNLTAGTPYTIVGACDDDCTNLDFELIAPQGGVVASDLLPDDFPVATYTPTENGQYIARLMMIDCSVAPCFAGARVLSGSAAPQQAMGSKP
jgi:hypothetical protein